jgi:phytoene synthase
MQDIASSYQYCRELTRTHARTFYFASHVLPRAKRDACYTVYAFCRYVDDLVDVAVERDNVTPQDARILVERWQAALRDVYDGKQPGNVDGSDLEVHPILTAWADTLSRYRIPRHLPDELVEGVLMDTVVDRFATMEDLRVYCYKVASVVGLMTSEIFGYDDPACLEQAIDLGIAMQLTNIIRDVKEDADRGRIYLPQSMMQEFGVREEDVLAHSFTPELAALLRALVALADHAYDTADLGILHLNADSRLTVQLMSTNYRQILRAVERLDMNVFRSRARTTTLQKLAGIPRAWWTLRRSASRSSSAHSRPETSRR